MPSQYRSYGFQSGLLRCCRYVFSTAHYTAAVSIFHKKVKPVGVHSRQFYSISLTFKISLNGKPFFTFVLNMEKNQNVYVSRPFGPRSRRIAKC